MMKLLIRACSDDIKLAVNTNTRLDYHVLFYLKYCDMYIFGNLQVWIMTVILDEIVANLSA